MKLPSPADSPVEHPIRQPGVTKLKKAYRDLLIDLASCEDQSSFEALMATSQILLERIKRELPDWWDGKFWNGADYEPQSEHGLAEQIERKRKELTR